MTELVLQENLFFFFSIINFKLRKCYGIMITFELFLNNPVVNIMGEMDKKNQCKKPGFAGINSS